MLKNKKAFALISYDFMILNIQLFIFCTGLKSDLASQFPPFLLAKGDVCPHILVPYGTEKRRATPEKNDLDWTEKPPDIKISAVSPPTAYATASPGSKRYANCQKSEVFSPTSRHPGIPSKSDPTSRHPPTYRRQSGTAKRPRFSAGQFLRF